MQLPEGLLPLELMWRVQGFLKHPTAEIMGKEITHWEEVKQKHYDNFMKCVCAHGAWKEYLTDRILHHERFWVWMIYGWFSRHQSCKTGCQLIHDAEARVIHRRGNTVCGGVVYY